MMAVGAPPIQIQKKKGSGCFGCGCTILSILVLLFVGLVVAGSYVGYHQAVALTNTAAKPVPQSDTADAVYPAAQQKISQFEDAFENRQSAVLRLNSDEINALIARDPRFTQMSGHFHVALQGSAATLQFDAPLGSYETYVMPDRFVNGNVNFGASIDPDTHSLAFDIHSMQIKDQPVPPSYAEAMNQLVNQTVNQQLQANQIARDFLARVSKIDIEDGELVLEIK